MNLDKEIPILTAQIRALYEKLDKQFGLKAAKVPITFGYDEDVLGSYTQAKNGEKEHFHFSLPLIAYAAKRPLSSSDRADLYKHEYAHYMQYNMDIPKEHCWQSGPHGSSWKYCCSLVGAAPTPYYKVGESLLKHDYDKALRNPINDKTVPIRDAYRREKEYQTAKNSKVQFSIGELVSHKKFGEGTVIDIEPLSESVRLHIKFGDEVKKIDQKWLVKSRYRKSSDA